MYPANPASPSTTPPSASLKGSASSTVRLQERKGVNTEYPLPRAVCSPTEPETSQGALSRSQGRLWSVGPSGPVTHSAINFLLINLVDSY